MKKKNLFAAVLLVAAAFTACSKDATPNGDIDPTDDVVAGQPTYFTLALTQPLSYEADPNATMAETKLNTADIFIFQGATLEKHVRLTENDFAAPVDNVYTSTTKISTTTGTKDIYAGVNLSDNMLAKIKANEILGGLSEVNRITLDELTTDNGFSMFSLEPKNAVLVEDPDDLGLNVVRVQVARMVAKVTVQANMSTLNLDVAGGTLSDLSFAMRNTNKLIYPLQQKNGSTVIDPNWADGSYVANDFESFTDYVAVDDINTDVLDLKTKYAPENTTQMHYQWETTYASIKANFVPDNFFDENGAPTPYSGSPVSFWVVTLPSGEAYYFNLHTTAETFARNNSGTISDEYENGLCYYNMFLNPRNGYNTIRNNYYKTTITSILGLGNPNPEDGGDKEIPVATPVDIVIEIDIIPWTLVPDDYDLR